MKLLEALQNLEITFTGGFAMFALLCIGYVTIFGAFSILMSVVDFFSK